MASEPPPRRTRMIVIDIDGTLMPSIGTRMSERNRSALREAEAQGVEIVIATGRRQAYAMPLLLQAELSPSTVLISSNGTTTRTFAGEPMDHCLLAAPIARSICLVLREFSGTMVFTFDRIGPDELVVESIRHLRHRIEHWVDANRPYISEKNPLESAFDNGDAPLQAMVCGSVSEMRRAEKQLAESELAAQIEAQRTEYPLRGLGILDVLPPGVSKGAALERLAVRRGFAREEVMVIGDNYNDLSMLEYAGQPVLMHNAPSDLHRVARERGWQMTADNDADGVAHAIRGALQRNARLDTESETAVVELPQSLK